MRISEQEMTRGLNLEYRIKYDFIMEINKK